MSAYVSNNKLIRDRQQQLLGNSKRVSPDDNQPVSNLEEIARPQNQTKIAKADDNRPLQQNLNQPNAVFEPIHERRARQKKLIMYYLHNEHFQFMKLSEFIKPLLENAQA